MTLADVLEQLEPELTACGTWRVVVVSPGEEGGLEGPKHSIFDVAVDDVDRDINLLTDQYASNPRLPEEGLTLDQLVARLRELSPACDDWSVFSGSAWTSYGEYEGRLDIPLVGFARHAFEKHFGFVESPGSNARLMARLEKSRPPSSHVCPWWAGYFLLFPLRRLRHNPVKWLGPFVREGMTVLEPGPGMGYFTLDLARMVGPRGRVVAVDLQLKMLNGLARRAKRAGLAGRIELRLAQVDRLGVDDLDGQVDLVPAVFVVHEMADQGAFFADAHRLLRPGGRLMIVEPRGHVKQHEFEHSVAMAEAAGFGREPGSPFGRSHGAVLSRR
jgi:SAM-dependent methyltransferase